MEKTYSKIFINLLLLTNLYFYQIKTSDQEIKISKESDNTKKINKFRKDCLNKYLIDALNNIVLEYTPINDKYYCIETSPIYLEKGYTDGVKNVVELKNGQLASCSCSGTVRIWKKTNNKYECIQTIKLAHDYLNDIIELKNGNLATGDGRGYLHILSPDKNNNYQIIHKIDCRCIATKDYCPCKEHCIHFLAELTDGSIVCGLDNGHIKIFQKKDTGYSLAQTLEGRYCPVLSISILTLNNSLISTGFDGNMHFWKNNNGIYENQKQKLHDKHISCILQLSNTDLNRANYPYNTTFATSSYDDSIKIWTKNENNECQCIFSLCQTLKSHNGSVRNLIELKNRNLVSCSYDKTIKIWQRTKSDLFEEKETLIGHQGQVRSIKQLKNKDLISCSYDGTMKIWFNEADQEIPKEKFSYFILFIKAHFWDKYFSASKAAAQPAPADVTA